MTLRNFTRYISLTIPLLLIGCKEVKPSAKEVKPSAKAEPKTAMPWEDPNYATNIRATQAEGRPAETWPLWQQHHENRKRWTIEKEVDLLMIGDSIVFRWSRNGKKVWDKFYGERNAVNIGSSGDRTYHMLWHLKNGGLEGMKNHNPKLIVMMIGTNNRGKPELHGEDTAYGILALLKEVHAQLPNSKILLMPIFPRGDTPEDEGRVRNNEINEIIHDYVDNKTVHWLDISHVFLDKEGKLNRDLMPDGLHPDENGYSAWAEAMEPTIKKFIGEPAL